MIRPTKIERTKENDEEKIEKTLIASRFVLNRILKGEKFVDISKIKTEWLANDCIKKFSIGQKPCPNIPIWSIRCSANSVMKTMKSTRF